MKKILIIFFIIILFFGFIVYRNGSPGIIISDLLKKGDTKPAGLRYKIYLLGIFPAGDAFLQDKKAEEYKGETVYHLNAVAQSSKVFSRFFSGSAIIDSYVDTEMFNPVLFKQKLVVSSKKDTDREVIYDQRQNIISIGAVRRQTFPNTQDPLSAILNIRRMDFDKIREFEMNINTNQKNYLLKAAVTPGNIKINNKIYKTFTLKSSISRRDKNPYHKSTVTMVLLKDKENIPILIRVFAGGILINAKLVDIK